MKIKKTTKNVIAYFLIFFSTILTTRSQQVAINEVMSSNSITVSDEDGDFPDWIEIYNYGSTTINLNGFGLSDNESEPRKWTFPNININPNAYLIIWASDKERAIANQPLHTNFKISSSGEKIVLSNSSGTIINSAPETALQQNISLGRQTNGTGSWVTFNAPTPNQSNKNTTVIPEVINPPDFSHQSGLYNNSFNLLLTSQHSNAQIIYTLDGSEPDVNNLTGTTFNYKNDYPDNVGDPFGELLSETYTSNLYSSPILIQEQANTPDKIANKNSTQDDIHIPPVPVRKISIIKAKTVVDNKNSKTISKTFLVFNNGNPYNLPLISIQTQENHLFDYDDGIYNAGVDFDNWRKENPDDKNSFKAQLNNYWRRGREWEFPASIQIFDSNSNSVLNVNAGFRVHGNNSRSRILKAVKLYARSEYDDKNTFEHRLFDQKIPGANLNYVYKRLLLRGDGSGGDVAKDAVFNNMMQPFFEGITRIKNVVHFINGEYWGLTAIRDRFDQHHFANHFGLDPDNIIIIDCDKGKCEVGEGTEEDLEGYKTMRDLIYENDMSNNETYAQAEKLLDMDSFIDNIIITIFVQNDSYERNFWKARNPENNGFGDGKWYSIIRDFESTLKDGNFIEEYTEVDEKPDDSLFGKLLENEIFRNKFINRFADLLNTGFTTERFKTLVNKTYDELTPYLDEDINRSEEREDDFYDNSTKQDLLEWIDERHPIIKNRIQDFFKLEGQIDIQLNVSNKNAGYINLNTVSIKPSSTGVNQDPYPWIGIYFQEIPITIEAISYSGYEFSHWSGDVTGTNPKKTISSKEHLNIIANYNKIESITDNLVYYWLFDDHIKNDTPLEKIDATYARNGLNASLNYSSSLSGYPFMKNNTNWRRASLERKNEPTDINYYPEANQNSTYSIEEIKGLQIKQPLKVADLENTLKLEFPTTNFKDIKVSFVVKSDGAAAALLVDYWNGSEWSNEGLKVNSGVIQEDYLLKELDFSQVIQANNKSNFIVRIRFNSSNLFEENNKVVIINNIAIEAESTAPTLNTEDNSSISNLKIYPNPTNNIIKILAEQDIDRILVYDLFGKKIYDAAPNSFSHQLSLQNYASGIYSITIFSDHKKRTSKIIKH